MSADPFAPIAGSKPAPAAAPIGATKWLPIMPVPASAPPPPTSHYKLGAPMARWHYTDAAGETLGFVHRFDTAEGKVFRPLIYAKPAAGGDARWRWESWAPKRPLYGLRALAERPDAPVVVCEGEKSADAAARLLPAMAATTSPNGSKSAAKADWAPLRGRQVVIWPDADTAGLEYANAVTREATAAGATSVAIVSPPSGVKVGWDAADALDTDGWDEAQAAQLVAAAKPVAGKSGTAGADGGKGDSASAGRRRAPPQRNVLIGLTEGVEFWHDSTLEAFASFSNNGHIEHRPVRSHMFRVWLRGLFYTETDGAIGSGALEEAIGVMEAIAINRGAMHETFVRTGRHGDKYYVDLCNEHWRVVEISADGWKVVADAPVKMLRSQGMLPLPDPDGDSDISVLRRFANVRSDDDFVLVVMWLVAALCPRGPYPVLAVGGEAGAGKSTFCRMLRELVDPNEAPLRTPPTDEHNLAVSASNCWLQLYDNMSTMPDWLADALCKLATGGGFATRKMYTDREESIFSAMRPAILNGLSLLTARADLASRAVTVHLRTIPEDEREAEDTLWSAFAEQRPVILAALLTGVSSVLRHIASVRLEHGTRMMDFARRAVAAEPGLGWDAGTFEAAYDQNQIDVSESSFEADIVAVAIREFVLAEHPREGWQGTTTDLWTALNQRIPEGTRKSRSWPQSVQGLGNRVVRAASLLRNKGFAVEWSRSKDRLTTIVPPRADEVHP